MTGYENREDAQAKAQECGGSVVTAWDGSYYVVGARGAGRLGRWLCGPDWHGYEGDLGASAVAYLQGGPDAAEAVAR